MKVAGGDRPRINRISFFELLLSTNLIPDYKGIYWPEIQINIWTISLVFDIKGLFLGPVRKLGRAKPCRHIL